MGKAMFEIYYSDGLKPGVSRDQAIQDLAGLIKASSDVAEKMIDSTGRVIKKGLTKDQANKYFSALSGIGLQVQVRESAKPPAVNIVDEPEKMAESVEEHVPVRPVDDTGQREKDSGAIQIQFNGKGFEYFKIWIVNILLTIVTLGVYSAWAKVRNKQYFYGNTQVDGSSFLYTAKPIAILKGRLIAVALFVLYALINEFFPMLGFILLLIFMAFLPWIIIRSLTFNARNSVFRSVRFDFSSHFFEAFTTFLLWPLLMLPTLGFILPFVWYKQSQFLVNNSAYGTTNFEIQATLKDFYKIFFIFLGIIVALVVVMALLATGLSIDPNNPATLMPFMMLSTPFTLIIYLFIFAYLAAALGNLYFNSISLADHGFTSQLKAKNLAWLYFSNTLAIAFSFGLLIPWAQVRMARYRISCLQLNVSGSLDNFIAAEEKSMSALGEQIGEVFDMEVSVI